eukprot:TRINITY_DN3907_c0_g1_i2.p1 TRINITY_DN3907_c0_g1~~TRINITY_DN3907_c0_g1_i2.p1  ORF type:complete len:408 (-),score=101.16 TRINITY_DN3907_c0_g1_i2:77-1300(-)
MDPFANHGGSFAPDQWSNQNNPNRPIPSSLGQQNASSAIVYDNQPFNYRSIAQSFGANEGRAGPYPVHPASHPSNPSEGRSVLIKSWPQFSPPSQLQSHNNNNNASNPPLSQYSTAFSFSSPQIGPNSSPNLSSATPVSHLTPTSHYHKRSKREEHQKMEVENHPHFQPAPHVANMEQSSQFVNSYPYYLIQNSPSPMQEASPYNIDPNHSRNLNQYIQEHARGRFNSPPQMTNQTVPQFPWGQTTQTVYGNATSHSFPGYPTVPLNSQDMSIGYPPFQQGSEAISIPQQLYPYSNSGSPFSEYDDLSFDIPEHFSVPEFSPSPPAEKRGRYQPPFQQQQTTVTNTQNSLIFLPESDLLNEEGRKNMRDFSRQVDRRKKEEEADEASSDSNSERSESEKEEKLPTCK